MTYAAEFGAKVFQLEHRFYGLSQPFANLTTTNLRYLSSEQALADAARFIAAQIDASRSSGQPDAKVVVFGGSYSGALAAFFRTK